MDRLVFGLNIPISVDGVPRDFLHPKRAWQDDPKELDVSENFETFRNEASPESLVKAQMALHMIMCIMCKGNYSVIQKQNSTKHIKK
jgi:hypothetical protein